MSVEVVVIVAPGGGGVWFDGQSLIEYLREMETLLAAKSRHPSAPSGGLTAMAMADALRQVADGLACSVLTALDPDWSP